MKLSYNKVTKSFSTEPEKWWVVKIDNSITSGGKFSGDDYLVTNTNMAYGEKFDEMKVGAKSTLDGAAVVLAGPFKSKSEAEESMKSFKSGGKGSLGKGEESLLQFQYFIILEREIGKLDDKKLEEIYNYVKSPHSMDNFKINKSTVFAVLAEAAERGNYPELMKKFEQALGSSWVDWMKGQLDLWEYNDPKKVFKELAFERDRFKDLKSTEVDKFKSEVHKNHSTGKFSKTFSPTDKSVKVEIDPAKVKEGIKILERYEAKRSYYDPIKVLTKELGCTKEQAEFITGCF